MSHSIRDLLVLIGLVALTGCAAPVPMETLEAEALRTGDWSAVEKRERLIARREARRPRAQCGDEGVLMCKRRIGETVCACTARENFRQLMTGRPW